jgi:hypothetical protein
MRPLDFNNRDVIDWSFLDRETTDYKDQDE